MFDLIKKNVIQFDKLLVEQYYKLGIDEVDTIILIRLHDALQKNILVLDDNYIAKTMKINKDELGKRIVNLVKKGYINLEICKVSKKEVFSLDPTYQKLANVLENKIEKKDEEKLQLKIKETILLLEGELKKILSPLEIEMVQRWYLEDKYSETEIHEAILKALKYKNRGVAYINRLLQTVRREQLIKETRTESQGLEDIQELFNRYYDKSK